MRDDKSQADPIARARRAIARSRELVAQAQAHREAAAKICQMRNTSNDNSRQDR